MFAPHAGPDQGKLFKIVSLNLILIMKRRNILNWWAWSYHGINCGTTRLQAFGFCHCSCHFLNHWLYIPYEVLESHNYFVTIEFRIEYFKLNSLYANQTTLSTRININITFVTKTRSNCKKLYLFKNIFNGIWRYESVMLFCIACD